MNHWFLVGRDLMWLFLAAFPPVCFVAAGTCLEAVLRDHYAPVRPVQIYFWFGTVSYAGILSAALCGAFQ